MDIFKDIIYINKQTAQKTYKSFIKNWPIVFAGIIYAILNPLIYSLIGSIFVGPLYIVAGMVMAIVSSAFISNFLYLLYNVINYDRITFQDFKDGFTYFIWKIYGVLFIGYLANLLLGILYNALGDMALILNIIWYLILLVIMNSLPETIYLKAYSPWDSILKAVEFMQENWFNWLLPNIIFYILLYVTSGAILAGVFNTHISFNMSMTVGSISIYLLGQTLFSIIMIYRGHLYKLLSNSTRRKRMFMNKF
ncbi:hypothetical protein ACTNDY_05160 [Tissierellaceae bacterium HCP3S3_D8]